VNFVVKALYLNNVTPLGLGMGENFFGYKYFTPTGFYTDLRATT
jgi:hypothetical protein